jgi:hypothetical protein
MSDIEREKRKSNRFKDSCKYSTINGCIVNKKEKKCIFDYEVLTFNPYICPNYQKKEGND